MPVLSEASLRSLMFDMFVATGTGPDQARTVGDSLVDANLAGHDSHGVIRIIQYLEQVDHGSLDPSAMPSLERQTGSMALVDGGWGWGQLAMNLMTDTVIELAGTYGMSLGTVERCFHIGRVAPYVERAARAGFVAWAVANAGPAVTPYGGRTRVMGTNPIAWAVPRRDSDHPISLDVATSFIAEGKLRVARDKGVPSPPGAVMNRDGHPSIDPMDFYDGGALQAFGGHKGSGFSIFAQLLGRGMTGLTPDINSDHKGSNGPVMMLFDPGALVPIDDFYDAVEAQVEEILAAESAEGSTGVQLPGEPEIQERKRREVSGIDVPERTWSDLIEVADRLGVEVDLTSVGD